jgi:hypothetical protein
MLPEFHAIEISGSPIEWHYVQRGVYKHILSLWKHQIPPTKGLENGRKEY